MMLINESGAVRPIGLVVTITVRMLHHERHDYDDLNETVRVIIMKRANKRSHVRPVHRANTMSSGEILNDALTVRQIIAELSSS